ncbi:Avirulence protein (Avh) [Phytophthora palmivora]|uniref:RxLR effector protein n=1 Tax=Phytophthora palmivora TaxID=4796 RepID=A0A2P4X8E6_9STRA|nr:Avirulence protein (Avh) [Phytophthora palmivora]
MRLPVLVLVVVALFASSGIALSLTPPFSKTDMKTRHLRVNDETPDATDTEERSPNVDIILKDTASKVNKATFRKLKFVVWKYLLGKTPQDARKKLGMELMGREVYSHKNWKQLVDYHTFYGKGPLEYPTSK